MLRIRGSGIEQSCGTHSLVTVTIFAFSSHGRVCVCVFCTEEDINVDGGTVSPAHMAGSIDRRSGLLNKILLSFSDQVLRVCSGPGQEEWPVCVTCCILRFGSLLSEQLRLVHPTEQLKAMKLQHSVPWNQQTTPPLMSQQAVSWTKKECLC